MESIQVENRNILKAFLVGGIVLTGLTGASQAMALTYQSNVNMSFTINPSLSIGLSAPELVISELAPGASSDSNTITVTVDTNASCGYVLNATVGQATSYETRDLLMRLERRIQ